MWAVCLILGCGMMRRAHSEQVVNDNKTWNFRSLSCSALLWIVSKSFTSFMFCGAQKCTQCSRRGCSSAEQRGSIPSLTQLAMSLSMPRRERLSFMAAWAHC